MRERDRAAAGTDAIVSIWWTGSPGNRTPAECHISAGSNKQQEPERCAERLRGSPPSGRLFPPPFNDLDPGRQSVKAGAVKLIAQQNPGMRNSDRQRKRQSPGQEKSGRYIRQSEKVENLAAADHHQ
jgi:hypothetical protein